MDDGVVAELRELTPLAPLHNAPALVALEEARAALPGVPHVAVFDTAFHATLPAEASTYAVPAEWRNDWGSSPLRLPRPLGAVGERAGSGAAPRRLPPRRRLLRHGRAERALGRHDDGLQPARGRADDDPLGIRRSGRTALRAPREGLTPAELDDELEHRSGLAGLSGGSGDVRELLAAETDGDDAARLALAVYVHRIAAAVGAMATSLGGLDALVFTAGVGEHAPAIRERVCARLGFLGVEIDEAANIDGRAGRRYRHGSFDGAGQSCSPPARSSSPHAQCASYSVGRSVGYRVGQRRAGERLSRSRSDAREPIARGDPDPHRFPRGKLQCRLGTTLCNGTPRRHILMN